MYKLPDQIGPLGRAQWQAQLDLAASLSQTALDNAGRLVLLQIEAARQWTLNAAEAWRHVLASAPLDWTALPARAPADWASMFRFGLASQPGAPSAGRDACAVPPTADDIAAPRADMDAPAAGPPAARTPLAAAAAEAVPGAMPVHPAAAFPPAGRAPLPKVKPMEAAPAPPQVAGVQPGRPRGRGPKK